jgi:hypothetical protein
LYRGLVKYIDSVKIMEVLRDESVVYYIPTMIRTLLLITNSFINPAGHYSLRFVYRRPYDGDLPKLTTYCWSVVHSMLLDRNLPLAVRRTDPTGAYRHCVLYVEYNVTYERQPTCTPASCAYYEWCRQQL